MTSTGSSNYVHVFTRICRYFCFTLFFAHWTVQIVVDERRHLFYDFVFAGICIWNEQVQRQTQRHVRLESCSWKRICIYTLIFGAVLIVNILKMSYWYTWGTRGCPHQATRNLNWVRTWWWPVRSRASSIQIDTKRCKCEHLQVLHHRTRNWCRTVLVEEVGTLKKV